MCQITCYPLKNSIQIRCLCPSGICNHVRVSDADLLLARILLSVHLQTTRCRLLEEGASGGNLGLTLINFFRHGRRKWIFPCDASISISISFLVPRRCKVLRLAVLLCVIQRVNVEPLLTSYKIRSGAASGVLI